MPTKKLDALGDDQRRFLAKLEQEGVAATEAVKLTRELMPASGPGEFECAEWLLVLHRLDQLGHDLTFFQWKFLSMMTADHFEIRWNIEDWSEELIDLALDDADKRYLRQWHPRARQGHRELERAGLDETGLARMAFCEAMKIPDAAGHAPDRACKAFKLQPGTSYAAIAKDLSEQFFGPSN